LPLTSRDLELPAKPRQKEAGSNRAQRAHESGRQAGEPEGPATEGRAVIPRPCGRPRPSWGKTPSQRAICPPPQFHA